MAGLIDIGVSALLANQRALSTTSQNIANANTEGYTRQRTELSSRSPQFVGVGFLGNGVQVANIVRIYNQFQTDQIRSSTTAFNQQDTVFRFASQVDNILADQTSGLQPVLNGLFSGLQDLSNNPASLANRDVFLSDANDFTSRLQMLNNRLNGISGSVSTEISSSIDEINSLTQGIAGLNQNIVAVSGSGGQPNDLLDQRDQLVTQLSGLVSVNTVTQTDGSLSVYIGNGLAIVSGVNSQSLSTIQDDYNSTRLNVAFTYGGNTVDISNQLTGGKLGGLMQFRSQVLDDGLNQLGRVAVGLTSMLNNQSQLGIDLNGNMGGLLFTDLTSTQSVGSTNNSGATDVVYNATVSDAGILRASDYELSFDGTNYSLTRLSDSTPVGSAASIAALSAIVTPTEGFNISLTSGATVNAGDRFLISPTRNAAGLADVAITDSRDIAAAAPILAQVSNLGANSTASIAPGAVSSGPPVDPNLTQTVTITFTGPGTFDVAGTGTGNPTGVSYTSGSDITYNGWTTQINGVPQVGDTFTIQLNSNSAGDNRNSLLMGATQNLNVIENNTLTIQEAFGRLVSSTGAQTRSAEFGADAQSVLLGQAINERQSTSGVNLDEEAANILRFQQAYQASAQIISISNSLFDSILNALR
ncbi:MAG TPA: flagellar hook-associated protein FlgK [Gammaproteobacteria bacterium]|nr:flagellar hook-associated protein FlgK [Gammaproteobacteria bacterium]